MFIKNSKEQTDSRGIEYPLFSSETIVKFRIRQKNEPTYNSLQSGKIHRIGSLLTFIYTHKVRWFL